MHNYPRIRDTREDRDYTQAEIARFLGVGTTQYQRWEHGEREIPIHKLIMLCDLYKVPADYLIGMKKQYPYPNTKIKIK